MTIVRFQNQAGILSSTPGRNKHTDLPLRNGSKHVLLLHTICVTITQSQRARYYPEHFILFLNTFNIYCTFHLETLYKLINDIFFIEPFSRIVQNYLSGNSDPHVLSYQQCTHINLYLYLKNSTSR